MRTPMLPPCKTRFIPGEARDQRFAEFFTVQTFTDHAFPKHFRGQSCPPPLAQILGESGVIFHTLKKKPTKYQQGEVSKGLSSCLHHVTDTEDGAGGVEERIIRAALEVGGVIGLQSIAPETEERGSCHGWGCGRSGSPAAGLKRRPSHGSGTTNAPASGGDSHCPS